MLRMCLQTKNNSEYKQGFKGLLTDYITSIQKDTGKLTKQETYDSWCFPGRKNPRYQRMKTGFSRIDWNMCPEYLANLET